MCRSGADFAGSGAAISGSAKGRSLSKSEGAAAAAMSAPALPSLESGETGGASRTGSGATNGSGAATISAALTGGGVNPWLGSRMGYSCECWLRDSRGAIESESSGSALMRVMESESPIAGSMAAPKRTWAFSGTNFCKRCIRSSISNSVRSSPPERWTSTVWASLSSAPWSSSGLLSAFFKALAARSLPSARPEPKRQRERFVRSALTSSSSPTLIKPGRTTRRMTALIDSQIMWSAAEKASWMPCLARTSSPMRLLSKVTSALDRTASSLSAVSAWSRRRLPSKANGMVAKTTTKAPSSRAMRVTMGAAPEPVPPPRPVQRKTIRRSLIEARIWSSASITAWWPSSGSPPEPRPFVRFTPSWIFSRARQAESVRRSVLRASNSEPSMPSSATRSNMLAPAPPRPMIFTEEAGIVCLGSRV